MSKPIIAETDHGARYGFKSVEEAKSIFPDCTIVSHQDGTPYENTEDAKPVSKMNRDELEAHAVTLGVENPGEFANVGELRDAISEAETNG